MARRAALRHHQHDDELPARKRTRRSITASSSPSASKTLIHKSSRKKGNAAVKELTNEHSNKSSRKAHAHANANAHKLDHTPNGSKGNMQSTVDDDDAEDAAHETLGEGLYQVEAIRKKRMHKGQTQYLIKWQGWPESANTWEPFDNVNTCADMIQEFEQSSGNKLGKRGRGRRSSGKMFASQENRENLSEAVKKGTSIKLGESTTDDDVGLGTQKVAKVISETELVVTGRFLHDKKKTRQDNLGCDEDKLVFKTGEIDEVVHEILEDCQDSILHKTPFKNSQESPAERKATESFLHAHGERSQVDRKVDLLQKETDSPSQAASTQKDASQEKKQSIRKKSDSHVEFTEGISPSKRKDSRKRKQESVLSQSLDPKEPVTVIAGDKSRVSMLENDYGFCKAQEQGIQEGLPPSSPIVKILKAVNHAEVCLDGEKDVTVLFKASRADGSEALVNNKYMRERYPMPLIDFYEKHLRYGASTM